MDEAPTTLTPSKKDPWNRCPRVELLEIVDEIYKNLHRLPSSCGRARTNCFRRTDDRTRLISFNDLRDPRDDDITRGERDHRGETSTYGSTRWTSPRGARGPHNAAWQPHETEGLERTTCAVPSTGEQRDRSQRAGFPPPHELRTLKTLGPRTGSAASHREMKNGSTRREETFKFKQDRWTAK